MGIFINVIGCDYVTEDNFHSEEPNEYTSCEECGYGYNTRECKKQRNDLELNVSLMSC